MTNLLVKFFEQQKELYGDEFILSNEKLDSIKNLLIDKRSFQDVVENSIKTSEETIKTQFQTSNLDEFYSQIKNCKKCPLGNTRTNFVFGVGNSNADLMLVGEAPGADEDRLGEPFVGKAGQLLNKILHSIDFNRDDVFIANILKCRPPGNRDPLVEEVEQCEPYLHEQIRIIQPKVILVLGRIAGQTLLKSEISLTNLRGRLHYYQNIPLIVTYHPAALLRNPQWKYPTWDDVSFLKNVYTAIVNGSNPQNVQFIQKSK